MANKKLWLIILVLALAFGMIVVGCDDDSTDDSGGGTFTLTDIPSEYNGKYALLITEDDYVFLAGAKSVNMSTETLTFPRISEGRVSIPMWESNENADQIVRYSGSDTIEGVAVIISDSETSSGGMYPDFVDGRLWLNVAFSKGNATRSWDSGSQVELE
jgi:hypothetical protein